jgi:hypothetical protein
MCGSGWNKLKLLQPKDIFEGCQSQDRPAVALARFQTPKTLRSHAKGGLTLSEVFSEMSFEQETLLDFAERTLAGHF